MVQPEIEESSRAVGDDDDEADPEAELVSLAEDTSPLELRDLFGSHLAIQQARDRRMEQEVV